MIQKSTTFTTILRVKKCHFHYDMQKNSFMDLFFFDPAHPPFLNFPLSNSFPECVALKSVNNCRCDIIGCFDRFKTKPGSHETG
jgi:hypothetical protein